MHAENLFAAAHVRQADNHAAIKAPGAQQRRIEHVGPVGGRYQDHAVVGLEAVHLDQQLVERLLALVVAAAQSGAAMAAYRVDFVDEDDAGGVLLALLKQVAHAARADADKHLHKVRTGDGEEGHIGLAGHSTGQQGLAGSRRSDQQHALGNAPAQLLELLRLAQVFDDLLQLFLGLIHTGHVFEGDLLLLHREQAGAALAKRQRLVAAGLHLPQHEEPDGADQNKRSDVEQDGQKQVALRILQRGADFIGVKVLRQRVGVGRDRDVELVFGRRLQVAVQFGALDGNVLHLTRFDLVEQIGVGELRLLPHARAPRDDTPQEHQTDEDEHPEHDCLDGRIHQDSSFPGGGRIPLNTPAPPTSP